MAKKPTSGNNTSAVPFPKRESVIPVVTNGEFLYLYDAEKCNPNGDPDNENKPRMDIYRKTNIVTDVRLKRYLRDYFEGYKKKEIFVTKPEGIVLNAGDRLKFWIWRLLNPTLDPNVEDAKKQDNTIIGKEDVVEGFIDVRLFGATIPIKSKDKNASGSSITITGPVQINWGRSLNDAELMETSAITSHFSSNEGAQGTMGNNYRLYYSFLAFHGIISAKRAQYSGLGEEDIKEMDEAFLKSIPLMATQSKIGQYPRLYIRLEYNCEDKFIGDMRRWIKLTKKDTIRSIDEVNLDISILLEKLKANESMIKAIYVWKDKDLKTTPNLDQTVWDTLNNKVKLL